MLATILFSSWLFKNMLIMLVLGTMLLAILQFLKGLGHLMISNFWLIRRILQGLGLLLTWFIHMRVIMYLMAFICLMGLIIALVIVGRGDIIASGILCYLIIQSMKLRGFYQRIQRGLWRNIMLMGFDLMRLVRYCISIMGQGLDLREIIKSILGCRLIQMGLYI